MRRVLGPIAIVAAVAMVGCGNDATKPPNVTTPTRQSLGWADVRFASQGLTFQRPNSWEYQAGKPPLLATMTSAGATIAIWRYPRTEPLPATDAQLAAARDALVAAAKLRDKTFTVLKAKGTRAAHHPAVVILARETVAGRPRRVRSTHIYADGGEVVVDAFAPPRTYPQLERPIFRHVVRSLRVRQPSG